MYKLLREIGNAPAPEIKVNHYFLGAMVTSPAVLEVLRRELRRLSPDVRIDVEQIKSALMQDVLKREVVEGEKADEARKKIGRVASKMLRAKKAKHPTEPTAEEEVVSDGAESDASRPEV